MQSKYTKYVLHTVKRERKNEKLGIEACTERNIEIKRDSGIVRLVIERKTDRQRERGSEKEIKNRKNSKNRARGREREDKE